VTKRIQLEGDYKHRTDKLPYRLWSDGIVERQVTDHAGDPSWVEVSQIHPMSGLLLHIIRQLVSIINTTNNID